MLYRLLVADDEQIVLDSIKFIIEKNFKDIVMAEIARSGREAIEKAEEIKPDIIFMDIKMPGINGIEAIREIKSRCSNTLFVIITAYEQFDFAKEAVNLGVIQYLLKPVNREKIIETVRNTIKMIDREREKRKKELELKEKIESILPVLEHGFIYSILLFDDHSKELEVYKGIFEINEMGGYIMTVEFGEEDDSGNIGNKIGLSVKSQSFYPYFRDIIKCRCRCLVGPIMLNRIVIFIPSDFTGDEYFQRLEALSIGDYILDKISEKLDADICIGIGRSYKGLENLSCSYKESLKAIRHAKSKETVHIMDVPVEGKINPAYPLLKEKVLLEKAYIGDASECIQAFEFIFDWLVTEYGNSIQNIKNKLIELMVLLYRLAWDYGAEENEFINRRHYLDEMLEFEELSKLKIWCRERIEYIVRSISSIREKKINSLILKARDYIDKNFKSEITLEDVSREVNVSPHYFSRLFKEETGENFIEYLTSVRIQKAKELLENECISVKEICYQVGYGDPNYFSRIFKKVVGITPTDYKRIIDSNPYKEAVQNK
ncbi:MAG: hypothetical protein JG777_2386 [Clostridia bacterium]|nr:hypothetical protein [Clostridia bacterium]